MTFSYPPTPTTLTGEHVTLLPMDKQYLPALQEAVKDGELWKLWYTFIPTPEDMEAWISKALQEQNDKVSLPFVVKRNSDNRIVGSTRYMNIEKDT